MTQKVATPVKTNGSEGHLAGENHLAANEVVDDADVSPRVARKPVTGRRVRAYPARGGTTVEVKQSDFAQHEIDNPTVSFDFRIEKFTLPVGGESPLSEKAADFLTKNYPDSFKYVEE